VTRNLILTFLAFAFSATSSYGLDDAALLSSRLSKILSEKIPNAEIRIPNLENLVKSPEIAAITTLSSVRLIEDRATGVALFELNSTDGVSTKIQTPYQALVKAPIAIRRIYPNTKLKKEDFRIDTINVAVGTAHDYRGVILYSDAKLDQMESKQTILEGQFVLSNAVQRQPDVHKGEMVKLELSSGDLTLTTSAVIQENASIGERVHVLTAKTKREMIGKVLEDHSVEVVL